MAVNATMSSRSSSPKRQCNFQDSRGVWRRPNGTILPLDESPEGSRAASPSRSRASSPRSSSPRSRSPSPSRGRSSSPKRTEDFVDSQGRERSPDGRYKKMNGSSSPRSRSPSPRRKSNGNGTMQHYANGHSKSSGHGALGSTFYSAISQLAKQNGKKINGGAKVSYEILDKIKLHHNGSYLKMMQKEKISVGEIHDIIHADNGAHKKISMHYIDRA